MEKTRKEVSALRCERKTLEKYSMENQCYQVEIETPIHIVPCQVWNQDPQVEGEERYYYANLGSS